MLPWNFNEIGHWIYSRGRFFFNAVNPSRHRSQTQLGQAGERAAARFLQRLGYRIVARSHRQRLGEIDLIALDGDCLVFVEVKTWASEAHGDPSQAVDRRKQEKLSRAALVYLKARGLLEHRSRFDVISIVWSESKSSQPTIRHFKSAFEAINRGQLF